MVAEKENKGTSEKIVELTAEVKKLARRKGASLVGVGVPARFDGAPKGNHPHDFLPKARSIVTIGLRQLWQVTQSLELIESSVNISEEDLPEVLRDYLYLGTGRIILNDRMEQIVLSLANFLEDKGYLTIFFPASLGEFTRTDIYPHLFSERHAAVRTGLAEFGLNNVALTKEYGPRVRFLSIITEAFLEPDPLLTEKICLGRGCSLCIYACCPSAIVALQRQEATDNQFWSNPVAKTDWAACKIGRDKHGCFARCTSTCPAGEDWEKFRDSHPK